MNDLETKLAEARERLLSDITMPNGKVPLELSWVARERTETWDACVAIAREVVAERDAEIARLEAQMRNEVCTCCGRERKGFAREVTLGEPVLSFECTPEAQSTDEPAAK
jgi:hypothetical protein